MPKNVTTIKGPSKTYKTTMLILVANEEAQKGCTVNFFSGEEAPEVLHRRGLHTSVPVIMVGSDHKDWLGKVMSIPKEPGPTRIWRIRPQKKEK